MEVGAKRYVDALLEDTYKSGVLYASRKGMTGPVSRERAVSRSSQRGASQVHSPVSLGYGTRQDVGCLC